MSASEFIAVELLPSGKVLPLRPIQSKHGNTIYAVLGTRNDGTRYNPPYGVPVTFADVIGEELPEAIKVLGQTHSVEIVQNEKGRDQVKVKAFPLTLNGEKKVLDLTLTDLGSEDGDPRLANVKASIHGVSGGGKRKVQTTL